MALNVVQEKARLREIGRTEVEKRLWASRNAPGETHILVVVAGRVELQDFAHFVFLSSWPLDGYNSAELLVMVYVEAKLVIAEISSLTLSQWLLPQAKTRRGSVVPCSRRRGRNKLWTRHIFTFSGFSAYYSESIADHHFTDRRSSR